MLLEYFWWGSVFLVTLPVMALLLVLGPRVLPEYRDPNAERLDLASAALLLVAVLAVVFGVKEVAQDGISWMWSLRHDRVSSGGGVRRRQFAWQTDDRPPAVRDPSFRAYLAVKPAGVLCRRLISGRASPAAGPRPVAPAGGLWSLPSAAG